MAIKNASYLIASNFFKSALTLVFALIITKFVSPADYGLLTFCISFVAIMVIVTDLGIPTSILRSHEFDSVQAGSSIIFMLYLGAGAAFFIGFLSLFADELTGMVGLSRVMIAYAGVTAFQIWATIPRAVLEKNQRYTKVALWEFVAVCIASMFFFIMLYAQLGIWALIWFHLITQFVRFILFQTSALKFTVMKYDYKSIESLLKVGSQVFIAYLISHTSRNLDKFLVGKLFGATSLGFYGLAFQFMMIPLMLIAYPVSNVLTNSLSKCFAKNDLIAAKKLLYSYLKITVCLTILFAAYLYFFIEYPIRFWLNEKWVGAVDYIKLMVVLGPVNAVSLFASIGVVNIGHLKKNIIIAVGMLLALLISIFFAMNDSVFLFIELLIVSTVIVVIVNMYFLMKLYHFSINELLSVIYTPLAFAMVTCLSFKELFESKLDNIYVFIGSAALYAFFCFGFIYFYLQKDVKSLRT